MTEPLKRFPAFMNAYGHYISALSCVLGFVLDATQLPSIEHPFTQFISFCYFGIAGVSLLLTQAISTKKIHLVHAEKISPLLPVITQFVFGGLFSVVFVYYFRSATLLVSWPLIILLGGLLVGNELFKKASAQLEFQIGVLFLLVVFFNIFYIPLLTGSIGATMFFFSVLVSVALLSGFILLLSFVAWGKMREAALRLLFTVSGIALVIMGFYFMNIIPPIPLVGKAAHPYHYVMRDATGNYLGEAEEESFREQQFPALFPARYHRTPGESVYFFSAVFAPLALHVPVKHVWEYWDEAGDTWVTSAVITFPVSGGREAGYRGYSEKLSAPAGLWRVLVQTEDDRTIASKKFYIVDAPTPPPLIPRVL